MRLSALALDYDGTIAFDDALDESVRAAIGDARARGIRVLIVTGRSLDELRRVAGDLRVVDAVVAENGAVVHFSDNGHTSLLAPPIPPAFTAELERRGIPSRTGQCLVDAAAADAPRILDVIRATELPLVLAFNRSRVMVLAQGISKATGLRTTLEMMRLSPRNTLAIGDAENDYPLLTLAEIGAAVEWGSTRLKSEADFIIAGAEPTAVAGFLRPLLESGRLPLPGRSRRRLLLGHGGDGREFSLAVRGRNILVTGDARSGKSWIAGLLCEQLILYGYSVCVLDPEGDYRSLEALPGVTILGGEDPPPTPRDLCRALRFPDRSVVVDLSRLPHDEKIEYIHAALAALNAIRRSTGLPHRIVLDEAHYFLHDPDASQLLDLDLNGYVVVTYNASRLPHELLAKSEVILVTCASDPAEIEALRTCCSTCAPVDAERWSVLGHLGPAQAVALPVTEETGGNLYQFTIGARLTPHVRHREKYVDVPITESHAFVFASGGRVMRARTIREFVEGLEHSDAASLTGYLRRGDFSRWIRDVFGDHALAADLAAYEARSRAGAGELLPDILNAVRARYDLTFDETAPLLARA